MKVEVDWSKILVNRKGSFVGDSEFVEWLAFPNLITLLVHVEELLSHVDSVVIVVKRACIEVRTISETALLNHAWLASANCCFARWWINISPCIF